MRGEKKRKGEEFFSGGGRGAARGGGAASLVPFKVGSREVYNYSTISEIASQGKPPRFARRPVCTEFSGQKRIGDFERRKENFLIIEFIRSNF